MGGVLQWDAPTDGEILKGAPMGKEIPRSPPLSIWSEVVILLEEWDPPGLGGAGGDTWGSGGGPP